MKAMVGIAIAPFVLAAASGGTALADEQASQATQGSSAQAGQEQPAQAAQEKPAQAGQEKPAQAGQEQVAQAAQEQVAQAGQEDMSQAGQAKPPQVAQVEIQAAQVQVEQEKAPTYIREPMRAPHNAFEIGLSTGYTQGFGSIADGLPVGRVADAGIGFGLDLAYRVNPMFSIGLAGQFQEFSPDTKIKVGTDVRGLTTTLLGTVHFSPYDTLDPFVQIGAGYRMLWTLPPGKNNDVLTHGFQLAKLNLGLDVRVSKDVAIGPMVGADLNLFLWTNPEGPSGNRKIQDTSISTYIYAGLQGRFDIGGTREAKIREISSR